MALLTRTPLRLSRSRVAGCRGLVPALQHTLRRHHATETSAANPDGAGFPAAGYEADVQGSTAGQVDAPLVFANWSVYKTKGALNLKPQKAEWEQTANGNYVMSRPGTFRFEMAAVSASSGTGPGQRRYNWDQKVIVDLSATELGNIIAKPDATHEYYHDSYKGQQGREGTITKTFKWSPAPDGSAYYVNAAVKDKINDTNYSASVSISQGEFVVFQELVRFAIPQLLGWADMLR